jgi:DNA-binding transcriptional regulator GbsR (MarR family)
MTPRGDFREGMGRPNALPRPDGALDEMTGALASDIAAFVEDFGLVMGSGGMPRAAGRITAWLLVCDPPEQSADDLAKALGASAGGVSTNVRFLTRYNLVERVGKAGDRRTFYRIAPNAWATLMLAREAETRQFRAFGEKGLALLAGKSPAQRERLAEMTRFFAFLEREMPALSRRYHEEKA